MPEAHRQTSFALVAGGLADFPAILRAAFLHPWVASYQIGFGPPLVRATPELTARAREARSAIDKLDLYLAACILDPEQRARLAERQRELVVRRALGPVEAEELDTASGQALELLVRLFTPAAAPVKVKETMLAAGLGARAVPDDSSPEALTGRFLIRLDDPRNERLLFLPEVRAAAGERPDEAAVLELRAPAPARALYSAWVRELSSVVRARTVDVGAPAAHAKVLRNGEQL